MDDPNADEDLIPTNADVRRHRRLLDSRIQNDGELSDSDDEGEGGRRNHVSHKGPAQPDPSAVDKPIEMKEVNAINKDKDSHASVANSDPEDSKRVRGEDDQGLMVVDEKVESSAGVGPNEVGKTMTDALVDAALVGSQSTNEAAENAAAVLAAVSSTAATATTLPSDAETT
jgi:hypothetical protein